MSERSSRNSHSRATLSAPPLTPIAHAPAGTRLTAESSRSSAIDACYDTEADDPTQSSRYRNMVLPWELRVRRQADHRPVNRAYSARRFDGLDPLAIHQRADFQTLRRARDNRAEFTTFAT